MLDRPTVGRLELRLGFLDGDILEISERRLPVFRAEVNARPDRVRQLLTEQKKKACVFVGASRQAEGRGWATGLSSGVITRASKK